MSEWQTLSLAEVADIRVSNVDKKSSTDEVPVLLCNYMDVYGNEYITHNLDFMQATATAVEIERFKVLIGDVIITKDSETPYDIGIPAAVVEDVEGLVCGYHLAFIRPDESMMDSVFLSKQISQSETARYFSRYAAGSTRYGLSNRAIAKTPISFPKLHVQRKIACILQTIDQAVERTEALIDKYQQIKAGLMHDLFTRGIGPNGQLRPPPDQAPDLYHETPIGQIPKDWHYQLLDRLATRGSGHTPSKSNPEYWNGGIKWLSLADSPRLDRLYVSDTAFEISEAGVRNSSAVLHPPGVVVLSRDAGVGKSAITTVPMAVSQHFMCWAGSSAMDNHFLYYWLQHNKRFFENIAMGSTILTIGLAYFKRLHIACPQELKEQQLIAEKLKALDRKLSICDSDLQKKSQQKAGLMHDLLTNKASVDV